MDDKMTETLAAATFLGGENVKLTDGRDIFVKALPVRQYMKLLDAVENEPARVELYTGLSPADVDSLPNEVFVKILEVGDRINLESFFRWGERQKKMAAQIRRSPGATDCIQSGVASSDNS